MIALPERYRIVRELGAGGAGLVFQALDAERGVTVAIKTMRSRSADGLHRFKQEFRSLQRVRHPNLIALGEMGASSGFWFFTMEYVDGVDFLEHVGAGDGLLEDACTVTGPPTGVGAARPVIARSAAPRPALDEARLRDAFGQLAQGLVALHAAGKVHRDIKPSNVLVTRDGRVVILDFGLLVDVAGPTAAEDAGRVLGTPAYMAPEQVAGAPVGPAADWYAAGVLLYTALVGRLPFTGSLEDVLRNKQRFEPAVPRDGVPPDLAALCRDLLRIDPAARPIGDHVLARLGLERGAPLVGHQPAAPFVGRRAELRALTDALARSRGGALAVLVEGPSGIGKTALVREFVERAAADPSVLVLSGRCSERESVPFKGVDGVVDALGSFLASLSPALAARLLPDETALLAAMFPVLRRVSSLIRPAAPIAAGPAGLELRARSFAALRRLVAQVAGERTLVVTIDDLQWSDADSLALLAEVVRAPDAPPLLLVATLATELGVETAVIGPDAVERALSCEVRRLAVAELDADDAHALVRQLASSRPGAASIDAVAVAREAGGHPLFIAELVRHTLASPVRAPGQLTLEQALRGRIERLAPAVRQLLQVTCLAQVSLTVSAAARASGTMPAQLVESLGLLGAEQLIRVAGLRASDRIEPYHSRIRAAVADALAAHERTGHHLQIAEALQSEDADPAVLALHWHGAGRLDVAARLALVAADQAARALAFERAARLYRWALELGLDTLGDLDPIRRALGEALANSGHNAEAAETFLAAAAGKQGLESIELRRRVVQQFLMSGHLEKGLVQLDELMRELDIPNPGSPRRRLWSLLVGRARLRWSGLRYTERPAAEIPARERMRVDVCNDAAMSLGLIDALRGGQLQTLNMIYSLRSGDVRRITRALVTEVIQEASMNGRGWQRVVDLGERLCGRLETRDAAAWMLVARGMSGTLAGRWREALDTLTRCRAILAENPVEIVDEGMVPIYLREVARTMTCGPLVYLGRLDEACRAGAVLLRESLERDDVASATHFRTGTQTLAWLSRGDPAVARRHADLAIAPWARQSGQVPNFMDAQGRVTIELYAGDGAAAWRRIVDALPALRRTFLLRVQYIRVTMLDLRGRAAACAARQAGGRARRGLLREVRRCADALTRERAAWSRPLGDMLRAAHADEPVARAAHLERAAAGFAAADMAMHAAVAGWALGLLVGGDRGRALIAAGRAWADAEHVVHPERIAAVLAPFAFA